MTRRDFAASIIGLALSLCAITAQAQPVGLDAFSLTGSPVRLREVQQVVQPLIMPKPIMLFAPDRVSDLISAATSTYVRASTAVRPDGVLLPANYAPYGRGGYVLLEGAATSYYCQPYSTTGGIITTEAPITRTVSLPATGSYVLWCKGGAGLSVSIAAGTAAGSGWGTIASGGYLTLNITTAGTVTVTPTGAAAGDQVQLTTGIFPTSFIPTPTTSPVTRASAGSDTSGNGLSIPLSQRMVDSLEGEMIDWSSAWTYDQNPSYYAVSGKTITCDASGNSLIRKAYKNLTVEMGKTYEISYTVSGLTGGMRVFMGSNGDAATAALPLITANGTYIAREVAASGTTFGVRFNAGASGSVTINYLRRVLENGQTNRGEGTICQWVDIPWPSSVLPSVGTYAQIVTVNNNSAVTGIYIGRPSGGWAAKTTDGINYPNAITGELPAGHYCIISQWSAALGRMRVGLWDPTTRTLTWSYPTLAGGTAYRGFFPIYGTGSQQRLRWGYGLGNLPIGVGPMLWYNSIITDDMLIWAAREVQP